MILFEKLLTKEAQKPKFVPFDDLEAKRVCLENWDKNGDGKLSIEEAADVRYIGQVFTSNKKIVSLKALRYFKIQDLNNDIFRWMTNLREVWIPPTVTHHAYRTFLDCPNIKKVVILSETPFTRGDFFNVNTYAHIPQDLKVYVPNRLLPIYKEAWKDYPYLSRLHPLSEYEE
jgi:hypothetical protein